VEYQFKMKRLEEVERVIGHEFKCRGLLVEALTHSSEARKAGKGVCSYERLEFLGDSIINFLMSEHFFFETQSNPKENKPKELHKRKASVVNNALLSLVLIEQDLHKYIIYNEDAKPFVVQIQTFVDNVLNLLKAHGSTTDVCKSRFPEQYA